MRRMNIALLIVGLLAGLVGCATTPTIYDITKTPAQYNGKDITVQGYYVWRPGDPGVSVLVKAVSTRDDGTDAQPLDTAVWLENFPAAVSADLHRPIDGVYGAVEINGRFEQGSFGPNGAYSSRLIVNGAKAIETVQRTKAEAPRQAQPNQVLVYELEQNPAQYNGQTITTRGFYYWTQTTSGLLVTAVEAEQSLVPNTPGINPQPLGTPITMEGFPPDLSKELNVGPANGFVWGLIEVTGRFETGGTFGLEGRRVSQLVIDPASVKPIK